MKKFSIFLISLLLACSVNTQKKIDLNKLTFNYTDDAYLFFRNMRQTQYEIEETDQGGWRIYRHEDRQTDTTNFYFNAAIIVNWKASRAYPIIEMTEEIDKNNFTVSWKAKDSTEEGTLSLNGVRRKDEMIFGAKLYNKMAEEVDLYVNYGNRRIPLFKSINQKEAFRITQYDFYRLTGLL